MGFIYCFLLILQIPWTREDDIFIDVTGHCNLKPEDFCCDRLPSSSKNNVKSAHITVLVTCCDRIPSQKQLTKERICFG